MHILGAGALGTVFANRLIKAGINTTLILRPTTVFNQNVQICKESKTIEIQVENLLYKDVPNVKKIEKSHANFVNMDELENEASNHQISKLIVLTKAHQAKIALENISSRLSNNAMVLLLCNGGLALYEELKKSEKLSHVCLVPGLTTHAAFRRPSALNPLCAVNAGKGDNWFGLIEDDKIINNTMKEEYENILNDLNKADLGGIDETKNSAIIRMLWIKLGVNCVMNPHTALLKCTNGQYINQKASLITMENVCKEVARISKYDKFCQPPLDADELVSFVIDKVNRSNKSSMLQDVCNNNLTEIDYLNSWVSKRSVEEGFDAITNDTLGNLIKICEEQYEIGIEERLFHIK